MKIKYAIFSLALAVTLIKPCQLFAKSSPLAHKLSSADSLIKNFNAVAAGGPIAVVITLGDTEGIRFEGDAEAIATLVTEIKGTALVIRPKVSWKSWAHTYKDKKITAYVNAKHIESLTMSGDGSISVIGTIKQENLVTTLSGSGSIKAKIDVNNFKAVLSGSGALMMSGNAEKTSATISGSGVLAKKDALKVDKLSAVISGSGKVYVATNGEINATISGSGSVYYTGNADISEKKILGSGGVKQL